MHSSNDYYNHFDLTAGVVKGHQTSLDFDINEQNKCKVDKSYSMQQESYSIQSYSRNVVPFSDSLLFIDAHVEQHWEYTQRLALLYLLR